MSEYQKKLKQHQVEMEQLTKQLPDLQAAAKEAKQIFQKACSNHAPYPHEPINAHGRVKSRIESLTAEIKKIQILIEWDEGIRFATNNIKKAKKEINQTEIELEKLEKKREKFLVKLQKLDNEKSYVIESAKTAEKMAAAAYASALNEGNDADEQRAEKALRQASESLATATRGEHGVGTAVKALAAELEKLDSSIDNIKQQIKILRQEQLQAARFMWADRLDKAAQEFADTAAHFMAADRALGSRSSFHDLYLPMQTPFGPRYISDRIILDRATTLTSEQLLAI